MAIKTVASAIKSEQGFERAAFRLQGRDIGARNIRIADHNVERSAPIASQSTRTNVARSRRSQAFSVFPGDVDKPPATGRCRCPSLLKFRQQREKQTSDPTKSRIVIGRARLETRAKTASIKVSAIGPRTENIRDLEFQAPEFPSAQNMSHGFASFPPQGHRLDILTRSAVFVLAMATTTPDRDRGTRRDKPGVQSGLSTPAFRRRTRSSPSDHRGSFEFRQLRGLVFGNQRIDQIIEIALDDTVQFMKRQIDPVIGNPALWEVISPNAFGTIAGTYLRLSGFRPFRVLDRPFVFIKVGTAKPSSCLRLVFVP